MTASCGDLVDGRIVRTLASGWGALARASSPELVIAGPLEMERYEAPLVAALVLTAAARETEPSAERGAREQLDRKSVV